MSNAESGSCADVGTMSSASQEEKKEEERDIGGEDSAFEEAPSSLLRSVGTEDLMARDPMATTVLREATTILAAVKRH